MISLTEHTIRSVFVNASRKEIADLTLPTDFADIDWSSRDYLGWNDRKLARRAYVIAIVEGEPHGVLLRRGDAKPLSRAQCAWCQDVNLTNEVAFYSAKRAGDAGRKGDTVGTLVCAGFECSATVRGHIPMAYIGFDVDAARAARIATLRERAEGFVLSVMHGAS